MKRFLGIALVILFVCSMIITGCGTVPEKGAVVETAHGVVQGKTEEGIEKYFGVPFAQPPIGELRFAPPQSLEAWDGTLDCTKYADSAVQIGHDESMTYSEDCLYLNIWAPEQAQKLPVYVFIHGGAYAVGSPSDALYDGTVFAKDGIVQVNVAYRMNALGFLPIKEGEDAYGNLGNMGTLDQIAALEWVKENIAAFGGDPNNITIGGESAGSFSVSNLIESPLAKGLFQQAIMESGNLLGQSVATPLATGDKEQAYDLGRRFMQEVGADSIDDLRAMDALELSKASLFSDNVIEPLPYTFWPVFDGKVTPEDPYTAVMEGSVNDVDILAGYNTDEGEGFVPEGITEQQYMDYVSSIFGDKADEVLARFPVDAEHTPTQRARDIFKTGLRVGSEVFADALSARGKDVYYYNFDYVPQSVAAEGKGAAHAMELLFVFQQLPNASDEAKAMADDIHARWANFIKNGDPNQGDPVTVKWPKYTKEGKETLILNQDTRVAEMPDVEEEAFFRDLLFGQAQEGDDAVWQAVSDAYAYTFPLVLMDATKVSSTNTVKQTDQKAPLNQLIHSTQLASADSKSVVSPNVDTIYTQAFFDLSEDAIVFEKPSADRFYSVEMIDAYTNCTQILGTAGDTQEARTYLITGPTYSGVVPEGMQQVKLPTSMAWMIVRTMVENKNDLKNVYALQEKMKLTPLAAYLENSDGYIPAQGTYDAANDFVPIERVLSLDPQAYFDLANRLMVAQSPTKEDAAALEQFAKIGVGPGLSFDASILGDNGGEKWQKMIMGLEEEWTVQSEPFMETIEEWSFYGEPIAEFGTEYTYRALVALGGLGANPLTVAMYPKAQTDEVGVQLDGKNSYTLHFDSLPPTKEYGFWSMTAYGEDDFLIDNPINRYAINDRSEVKYNEDGSLDVLVQVQPPEDESLTGNWLPVKEEEFHLFLRIYLPNENILLGEWPMPSITVNPV